MAQGQLMQITMMATPNMNKELHYLNKEDKLLRWLLVKHRNIKIGASEMEDRQDESSRATNNRSLYDESSTDEEDDILVLRRWGEARSRLLSDHRECPSSLSYGLLADKRHMYWHVIFAWAERVSVFRTWFFVIFIFIF